MKVQSSYEEYLYQKIDDLQLININDACMGIVFDWVGEGQSEIPHGVITEYQKEEIALVMGREREFEEYNVCEASEREKELRYERALKFEKALKPVHEWLVKNICKAIQQNEIKPLILRLSINGDIIPEQTYVFDEKILKWLGYRGIEAEIYNDEIYFLKEDFNNCLESIFNCINRNSHWLSLRIRGLDHEVDTDDIDEDSDDSDLIRYEYFNEITTLKSENKRLRNEQNKPNTKQAINKHSERHAKKREQVLGAAISVMANYPELCRNKSNRIEATKIRTLVEEKALLFWPETGQPPLSTENIERLIRDWIKKTGE